MKTFASIVLAAFAVTPALGEGITCSAGNEGGQTLVNDAVELITNHVWDGISENLDPGMTADQQSAAITAANHYIKDDLLNAECEDVLAAIRCLDEFKINMIVIGAHALQVVPADIYD